MLQRVEHESGLVTYQSPLLNERSVPHAFSTRIGGLSSPPFDTLNLGTLAKGEPPTGGSGENTYVAENFRRLRRTLGLERHVRVEAKQVHGADVADAPAEPIRPDDAPCADALVSDRPGTMLLIRTADCVPVLFASRGGSVVAAAHAGWRGIIAGVIPATVHRLYQHYKVSPQDLFAAVGPCISAEAFEVGPEVGVTFADAGLEKAVLRTGAKPHIDLRAAVLQQLAHEGIPVDQVDHSDRCTYRDEEEFFSHRRDVTHRGLAATGRMGAVIALAGERNRA